MPTWYQIKQDEEANKKLLKEMCDCGHPREDHYSLGRNAKLDGSWQLQDTLDVLGKGKCWECQQDGKQYVRFESRCEKFENFNGLIAKMREEESEDLRGD